MIFWTEDNFNFISNCRNSFNCKLKKLMKEQTIIFLDQQVYFVHLLYLYR